MAAGQTENVKTLRMPMASAARAIKKQVRKDDTVEVNGLGAGHIFAGKQLDNRGRETIPRMVMTADNEGKVQNRTVGKVPTSSLDFSRMLRCEDRDEGGGQSNLSATRRRNRWVIR